MSTLLVGIGIGFVLLYVYLWIVGKKELSIVLYYGWIERLNPFYWRDMAQFHKSECESALANEDRLREQIYGFQEHSDGLSNHIKNLNQAIEDLLQKIKTQDLVMLGWQSQDKLRVEVITGILQQIKEKDEKFEELRSEAGKYSDAQALTIDQLNLVYMNANATILELQEEAKVDDERIAKQTIVERGWQETDRERQVCQDQLKDVIEKLRAEDTKNKEIIHNLGVFCDTREQVIADLQCGLGDLGYRLASVKVRGVKPAKPVVHKNIKRK